MSEKWWVEYEDGTPVFGPALDREMALSMRTFIEETYGRDELWVRQRDERDGWVVMDYPHPAAR